MDIDEAKIRFLRHGQLDRVKFIEGLTRKILPTQLKRIQQNDKTVLKDLVLPKWMDWELIYSWSNKHKVMDHARPCILCNNREEVGIDYKGKFICDNCFLRIKNWD